MGKKYIIEIIEKPFKDDAGREVWRAKGFNTLYFDQNGLDKLEEYVEPDIHKFEVGDVCYISGVHKHKNGKFIIVKIDEYTINYMESDGSQWSMLRSPFERRAIYMYHLDSFVETLKRDFL